MNEFFILAEISLIVVLYVMILHAWSVIHQAYKDRKNKPEIMSSEDDINIK